MSSEGFKAEIWHRRLKDHDRQVEDGPSVLEDVPLLLEGEHADGDFESENDHEESLHDDEMRSGLTRIPIRHV